MMLTLFSISFLTHRNKILAHIMSTITLKLTSIYESSPEFDLSAATESGVALNPKAYIMNIPPPLPPPKPL